MMRILITGGAGYLGSVMVPVFLKEGHRVVVIDNFMYGQNPLAALKDDRNLTVVKGDVRDEALIKRLLDEPDAIFPLACYTGAPLCDKFPKEAEEVSLKAIGTILKYRSKNQMIIFPTTNSGYGVGEKGKFCTEETPLRPISLYGRLKVRAEEEILNARNGITLRLATAFGVSPRMRLDLLVNDFTYKAVHVGRLKIFEGHFKRNYIHVKDIAKAFKHMLNGFDTLKDEPYNVGLSDANLSKLELCAEIKKQIPEFEFEESKDGKDPDQRDYIVSNEKIEKTGFRPEVSLPAGIAELIGLYRATDLKTVGYQVANV